MKDCIALTQANPTVGLAFLLLTCFSITATIINDSESPKTFDISSVSISGASDAPETPRLNIDALLLYGGELRRIDHGPHRVRQHRRQRLVVRLEAILCVVYHELLERGVDIVWLGEAESALRLLDVAVADDAVAHYAQSVTPVARAPYEEGSLRLPAQHGLGADSVDI